MTKANALHKAHFTNGGFEVYRYAEILDYLTRHPVARVEHALDFYSILLVSRGRGVHVIDSCELHFQPRDMIFVSRNQVHCFDLNRDIDGYSLAFTEDFLYATKGDLELLGTYSIFNSPPEDRLLRLDRASYELLQRTLERLEREFCRPPALDRDELLRCHLKTLLIEAERIKRGDGQALIDGSTDDDYLRFKRLIEGHFTRERSVGYYAQALALSARKLNEIVKRVSGVTAKATIDDRVLLEAKRQLRHTSASIKEIAHRMGFTDSATFVKIFKKLSGKTPTAYRTRR